MMQLNVSHKGEQCALCADGQLLFHASWRSFDELVEGMRRIIRRDSLHEHGNGIHIRAEQASESVLIEIGRWSSACTMNELRQLSMGMHKVARLAESTNDSVLLQQVADGALLARIGLPFGLSNNPRVKDAIASTVATDSTLRKAIPFPTVAAIPDAPVVRQISKLDSLRLLHSQRESARKDLYGQAS